MTSSTEPVIRPILRTVAFLGVLFLLGCGLLLLGGRSDAVSVAQSIKTGVVSADEINIAFENVGGKLLRHYIQESDHVTTAQVLMEIDPSDLTNTVAVLEAQLLSLEAQLAKQKLAYEIAVSSTNLKEKSEWRRIELLKAGVASAEAVLTLASTEYRRTFALLKTKALAQSDLDKARATLTQSESALIQVKRELNTATIGATEESLQRLKKSGTAEGMELDSIANERLTNANMLNDIRNTESQIKSCKVQIAQEKLNLSRLTLKAPERGKILRVLYEDGEMISANSPAVILETDRRYVDIYVSEMQVLKFKPGSEVSAFVPALNRNIIGSVRFATVTPSFADLRNTRERGQSDLTNFQVRIYFSPSDELLPGMSVEVQA